MSIYITTLTMLSGMFVLGGVSLLFRVFKTNLLKLMLLFILSIFFISTNFWSQAIFDRSVILFEILSLLGCTLCIIVLPYLTMAILTKKMSLAIERTVWSWNIVYIFLGISFLVKPNLIFIIPLVGYMLLLSIITWIVVMFIFLRDVKDTLLKRSLSNFLILSGIFFILLVLDMLITTLPIERLKPFDNTSLAFYFLGINIGIFTFTGKFLNRDPYIAKGKLTDSFKREFNLTPRECEIIEKVYEGSTNNQIGEELFISGKTVENHLGNIYQKVNIKSRIQLIALLNKWKKA